VENLQVVGTCGTCGEEGRCTRKFCSKNLEQGEAWGITAPEGGKEILKMIGYKRIKIFSCLLRY